MQHLNTHRFVLQLKHHQTQSEIKFFHLLHRCLKESFPDLFGKVTKQAPVRCGRSFYILDFYIGVIRLAFEIDGGYHFNSEQLDKDLKRDARLNSEKHILVKHVSNDELTNRRTKRLLRLKLEGWITARRRVHRGIQIRRAAARHGWKKILPEF